MTDIRINLVLPVLRIGAGPFSFDPIAHLLGEPIVSLLEPILAGPVQLRPSDGGPAVEVYPLRLPDGEGAKLALGALGALGVHNVAGRLVLTVPKPAARWIQSRFGAAIVDGPREAIVGDARVTCFVIELQSGMRASLPIGALGELGIEAA